MASHRSYLTILHYKADNDKLSDSISEKLNNHTYSQITKEGVDTEANNKVQQNQCTTKSNGCRLAIITILKTDKHPHSQLQEIHIIDPNSVLHNQHYFVPLLTIRIYVCSKRMSVLRNFRALPSYQDHLPINYLSIKINLPTSLTYEQKRQAHVHQFSDGYVGVPVDDHSLSGSIDETPATYQMVILNANETIDLNASFSRL
ncbi:hypothetical protein GJ496_007530 [Pomphorhynchus laevis]|nr:hypothetical protein GJ496_007530 [Pomphorhynchus laevis]